MKVIELSKRYSLDYPVGKDMESAMLFIAEVSKDVISLLKKEKKTVVNIWVKGSSGAILGALLAAKLYKYSPTVFYIRKESEKQHGENTFGKSKSTERKEAWNVIIDDFISSGDTIKTIWNEIKSYISLVDALIVSSHGLETDWEFKFKPRFFIHGLNGNRNIKKYTFNSYELKKEDKNSEKD